MISVGAGSVGGEYGEPSLTLLAPTAHTTEGAAMPRQQRSTPAGEHRPVLLNEVLESLAPQPGEVVVDCTTGWGGHSVALLQRVGPTGRLIGLDLDAENLPQARGRLEQVGIPFSLHHTNFAALPSVLGELGLAGAHTILADLGMSSMQVDDIERGFSYARDGPLDMRMDRSRGRTAAELLATISEEDLATALGELADEPEPARVAKVIIAGRSRGKIERTGELARLLLEAAEQSKGSRWRLHPSRGKWELHPAARSFQALRILVNRELASLEQLLRIVPSCLLPGGRAAIISFHSGEDRLIKAAFRAGQQAGTYARIAADPVRASEEEKLANPRSRSAKLRWAVCG
jgi:16S rRNA (cytosine1402-N4)-methyltransferase